MTNVEHEEAKPKIFVFINGGFGPSDLSAVAIAEDGTVLAGHVSSSEGWARRDMGFDGSTWKHDMYAAHYPDGYDLEWVDSSNDAPLHDGLMAAIARSNAKAEEASEVSS